MRLQGSVPHRPPIKITSTPVQQPEFEQWTMWLLLLGFCPSTHVLAVAIVVISSVRWAITNDQRLTEWSLLYISNTFFNILAVLNNAVFCITPTFFVIRSFSIHPSNSLPRAPITTGMTCQLKLCLVFLPLSRCHTERWYPTTLSLFHFLLLLLGCVHTIFSCVLTHSSYKSPNRLSLLHCCVISYIFS